MKKLVLFILISFLVSCGTVPLTGRKQLTAIPTSQMLTLSTESYQKVLKEVEPSNNKEYIRRVNSVGKKIANAVEIYMGQNGLSERIKNFDWEYHVLQSEELNAWCMPGGKIAFYEGIMPVCRDDNGVAVVMAHEVAHAIARHGNERMSQQLALQLGGIALSEAMETQKETTQQLAMLAFGVGSQVGLMLPYSRLHESEADELGLYFMAMAGFDPREAPEFWKRMESEGGSRPPEFLSTHPNPNKRIRNLEKLMSKALKYYNK